MFCDRSCEDNIRWRLQLVCLEVFWLRAVSNIKTIWSKTMKVEWLAIPALRRLYNKGIRFRFQLILYVMFPSWSLFKSLEENTEWQLYFFTCAINN